MIQPPTTPTTYKFTGQRQEADLGGLAGLYFYKARWYDAYLNRWLQPDTIIPDPYNSIDWDRFAYGRNNPVKFIDPTGHTVCTPDQPGCHKGYSNGLSPTQQYQKEIKQNFGWSVKRGFSLRQLQIIWNSGWAIKRFVELNNSLVDGRSWIKNNLGNAVFRSGGILQRVVSKFAGGETSFVGYYNNTVHMSPDFDTFSDPLQHVVHELGHVWDNNSIDSKVATWEGGGLADMLVQFVGGNPEGYRWRNGTSGIPEEYQWQSVIDGNRSTADYFAEAFSWSVVDPTLIPQTQINLWIISVVSLTGK